MMSEKSVFEVQKTAECTVVLELGATSGADGLSFGRQQVLLGAGGNWLCPTQKQLLASSHRSHPCIPPTTKTLPMCKPHTPVKLD